LHLGLVGAEVGPGTARPAPPTTGCSGWRQEGLVYHRTVPPDEAGVLPDLAAGTSFALGCERLRSHDAENAARRAAQLLANWTASGLLASIS
jgi:hypothetical protein